MNDYQCPGCSRTFSMKPEYANRKAKCPSCGSTFRFPNTTRKNSSDSTADEKNATVLLRIIHSGSAMAADQVEVYLDETLIGTEKIQDGFSLRTQTSPGLHIIALTQFSLKSDIQWKYLIPVVKESATERESEKKVMIPVNIPEGEATVIAKLQFNIWTQSFKEEAILISKSVHSECAQEGDHQSATTGNSTTNSWGKDQSQAPKSKSNADHGPPIHSTPGSAATGHPNSLKQKGFWKTFSALFFNCTCPKCNERSGKEVDRRCIDRKQEVHTVYDSIKDEMGQRWCNVYTEKVQFRCEGCGHEWAELQQSKSKA